MSAKVFLSQSGETSRAVAEALAEWIPNVIQSVQPFVSSEDIEKGARWATDIARELEASSVGVLCMTADNLEAPWIMFEAGALSKTVQQSRVIPYLLDIEPTDMTGPLVQFQAARANKDETRQLMRTINGTLTDGRLPDTKLETAFEVWWPKLQAKLDEIRARRASGPPVVRRSTNEMLEEILALSRVQAKQQRPAWTNPPLRHPIFARLKKLLGVTYRVYFVSRDELGEWLTARGFMQTPEPPSDPGMLVWTKSDKDEVSTLAVTLELFDDKGRLIAGTGWTDSWVELTVTPKKPPKGKESFDDFPEALDPEDDDLPF
jgi:hypothetical protein